MTPEQWFSTLPFITKTYFTLILSTTLLCTFGVLSPALLYLDWDKVLYEFNFWRLATAFIFFGKFSMPFIFQIAMMVHYFRTAEQECFSGLRGRAEMLFLLACSMCAVFLISYVWLPVYFAGPILIFVIVYVWSRKDPLRAVVVYGFTFRAWHLPFLLLLMDLLFGNPLTNGLIGIAIGHTYHFAVDVVPRRYGRTVLYCPQPFYSLVESWSKEAAPVAQPPPMAGFRAGQGYSLE